MDKLGDDNVVSLITKICKHHQCEYMILPGQTIHVAKKLVGITTINIGINTT